MKNIFKVLIPIGVITGAYFLFGAQKLKGLVIKLGSVSKVNINLDSPSIIKFSLYVTNPNAQSITFNSFYGQLLLGSKVIGSITKIENVLLNGKNATTNLKDFEAKVEAIDVITELLGGGALTITLQGTLVADGLKYPVKDTTSLSA
jgi:hypothetical protein